MLESLHAMLLAILAFLGLAQPSNVYQGYVEGEYVLVAPQLAGNLETLDAARGQHVKKGDGLYSLEHASEQALFDQAKATVDHNVAVLADLIKGKRQPEIDQLLASRKEATAAVEIARINVDRDEKQMKAKAVSQATLDTDQATLNQAAARLAEADAALATARLATGRDDAVHAAEADVAASEAALAAAQWKLDQKIIKAPNDAFVFDTLYRPGEYIALGQPVVTLLPAANIKVRFFASAPSLPALTIGQEVSILETGQKQTIPAKINYISPTAEYSPPELYNRDNREKLLFMIEATPIQNAEALHLGLPVDVRIDEP